MNLLHHRSAPWLAALITILLLLTACSSGNPQALPDTASAKGTSDDETKAPAEDNAQQQKEQETNEKTAEPESKPSPFVNPFTGLPVSEDRSAIRPLVVAIENSPAAYPQSGLIESDLVYEIMVEGGITRFLAVYQSNVNEDIALGPIRSARHNFYDFSRELDSVFVHAGASQKAYAIIQSGQVRDIDEITMGGPFYRVKEREMPHNLYASLRNLKAFSKRKGYKDDAQLQPLPFAKDESELASGEPANKVTIRYHSKYAVAYEYSADSNNYTRYMRGKPHLDLTTGKALTADNIVVQYAEYTSIDKEDRQDIRLIGGGKGYVATNGTIQPITWKKTSTTARTELYTSQGELVKLKPGKTFWQVIPVSSGSVEWEE